MTTLRFPGRSDKCNAMMLLIWEKNDPKTLEVARKEVCGDEVGS